MQLLQGWLAVSFRWILYNIISAIFLKSLVWKQHILAQLCRFKRGGPVIMEHHVWRHTHTQSEYIIYQQDF